MGIIDKIKQGLEKTKKNVTAQISGLIASFTGINDAFFEELEETLIMADLGYATASASVSKLREIARGKGIRTGDEIKAELTAILTELLEVGDTRLKLDTKPSAILIIGVNGVGKTTTIGKLAINQSREGRKVLLCAGDTFRAAAAEQLDVWAKRAGADIVKRDEGADPSSVIYDAISAAKARGIGLLICDTAGRLHNKANLMNELKKMSRIISRELPGCDIETLLVIDATTGQNGLLQAKTFMETADVTGIVLTKLDGTAKGGIVYAIAENLRVPVKLVGVGEGADDLVEFNAREFSEAILG